MLTLDPPSGICKALPCRPAPMTVVKILHSERPLPTACCGVGLRDRHQISTHTGGMVSERGRLHYNASPPLRAAISNACCGVGLRDRHQISAHTQSAHFQRLLWGGVERLSSNIRPHSERPFPTACCGVGLRDRHQISAHTGGMVSERGRLHYNASSRCGRSPRSRTPGVSQASVQVGLLDL